jgi:hypothetical protein
MQSRIACSVYILGQLAQIDPMTTVAPFITDACGMLEI